MANEETIVEKEVEPESTIEERARVQGWRPKEEYEGNPDEWVDAAEFVRRGPLIEEIKRTHKELKDLKRSMKQFAEHHKKTKEAAYKEALEELKSQKKEALANDDHDAVVELDEKIAEVKEEAKKETTTKTEISEAVESWKEQNQWFGVDAEMTRYAKIYGNGLLTSQSELTEEEVLAEVTAAVKTRFPEKFKPSPRNRPAPVAAGNKTGRSDKSGKLSYSDLSPIEKKMHDEFVRKGVLTSEQYIADIAAQRGAK